MPLRWSGTRDPGWRRVEVARRSTPTPGRAARSEASARLDAPSSVPGALRSLRAPSRAAHAVLQLTEGAACRLRVARARSRPAFRRLRRWPTRARHQSHHESRRATCPRVDARDYATRANRERAPLRAALRRRYAWPSLGRRLTTPVRRSRQAECRRGSADLLVRCATASTSASSAINDRSVGSNRRTTCCHARSLCCKACSTSAWSSISVVVPSRWRAWFFMPHPSRAPRHADTRRRHLVKARAGGLLSSPANRVEGPS